MCMGSKMGEVRIDKSNKVITGTMTRNEVKTNVNATLTKTQSSDSSTRDSKSETKTSSIFKKEMLPESPTKRSSLYSLISNKDWDGTIQSINESPLQAQKEDKAGDLPIHNACLQGAPFNVIQHLITAYKDGVKTPGFCGRLPLHYAAYVKPSLHVVKLLLTQYPDGAKQVDSDGRLPLHLAVVRNAPRQIILELVNADPSSVESVNAFGSTPVMLARNDFIQDTLVQEEKRSNNNINRNSTSFSSSPHGSRKRLPAKYQNRRMKSSSELE